MSGNALRITAILLFIGAVLVGWYGIRMSHQPEVHTPAPVSIVRYSQVVARQDVPAGHVLLPEDLALDESETQNQLAYTSTASLVGRMVESHVEKGAILLPSHFPQRGPAAQLLKSGERGVAIKVDDVVGVGGFIQPGDHVDVLVYLNNSNGMTTDSSAQSILKDVRVLSYGETLQQDVSSSSISPGSASMLVNGNDDKHQALSGHSAVIAVKEEDVARLMLAASGGTLRLSLRGANPELPSKASDLVRLSEIAGTQQKPPVQAASRSVKTLPVQKKTEVISVIVHAGDKTETISFKGQ
ncbi:Flp pilus assembly protein CpaB [Methylobacillus arboreus]|uniref:Flp pilus assembly protein CpaB n=1 Tax=Methylobacillus arboreus TaxID=755170 RepID=UPI00228700A9|nr:Flp pilus assembly protein CpaB [Methylobacillus arboreus]MCB5189654.1 Flp pilus assembly protein CpaB [Methylobacillus arboreus]